MMILRAIYYFSLGVMIIAVVQGITILICWMINVTILDLTGVNLADKAMEWVQKKKKERNEK